MNEVKRQAMEEVQKAVAEAEQKAFEMIASERAKMEKTLAEAKRKAQEDAIMVINEQEDSSEVSKDCGCITILMVDLNKRAHTAYCSFTGQIDLQVYINLNLHVCMLFIIAIKYKYWNERAAQWRGG